MVVHSEYKYGTVNLLNLAVRIVAEGIILFCILAFVLHEVGIISSPGTDELLMAGLVALFADMRRLESDMRADIKYLGSNMGEVREKLGKIESRLESFLLKTK